MNRSAVAAAIVILFFPFAANAQGGNMEITQPSPAPKNLSKDKLDRVKRYIIAAGKRCTYSNMYSNNPCLEAAGFMLYLNPDPGPNGHPQWNSHCDTTRGDFNTLVVQEKGGAPAFHAIGFLDANAIAIRGEGKNPGSVLDSAVLEVLRRMASE